MTGKDHHFNSCILTVLSLYVVVYCLQSRELTRLDVLRQSYISHMTVRLGKVPVEGEEGHAPQRREIQFLEKNLDELSRAHKKVHSNITASSFN